MEPQRCRRQHYRQSPVEGEAIRSSFFSTENREPTPPAHAPGRVPPKVPRRETPLGESPAFRPDAAMTDGLEDVAKNTGVAPGITRAGRG